MASMKIVWAGPSESQFKAVRKRAAASGRSEEFTRTHNEVVAALSDLAQAISKGEPLYNTIKPGGKVRHWVHRFISVHYAVFPAEQVGWVVKYQVVPETWPE